jgi:hypothetical protein
MPEGLECLSCLVSRWPRLPSGALYRRLRRSRRRAPPDPLTQVFGARELGKLDAHLEQIAADETCRLHANVVRYVAGDVGHVVGIWDSGSGVALRLSDGRRLALGGVSHFTTRLLVKRAAEDKLRLARVELDGFSYRLLLRGEAGATVQIYARRVALAP